MPLIGVAKISGTTYKTYIYIQFLSTQKNSNKIIQSFDVLQVSAQKAQFFSPQMKF
jgi:hypothetical protein